MKRKLLVLVSALFCLGLLVNLNRALAGCGCDTPVPPPGKVIPFVAYTGVPIRLYSDLFKAGSSYMVWFGTAGTQVSAALDRQGKKRIKLLLPGGLPLGPNSIRVTAKDGSVVLSVLSSEFTVASAPLTLPGKGIFGYPNQTLAVGADGTLYIPLNIPGVSDPLAIKGWMKSHPMNITVFRVLNVQGHDLELFGLRPIQHTAATTSDIVEYDRHSFVVYYQEHADGQLRAVDTTDTDYHANGSNHVDHDRMILAIGGTVSGKALVPGKVVGVHVEFEVR